MSTGEIIFCQNTKGSIKTDVRLEEETVWLTHEQMDMAIQKSAQ